MNKLSFALYWPLMILGAVYVVLRLTAYFRGNRDQAAGERFLDLAFGVMLLAGAYAVVMTIVSAVQFPNRIGTMLSILAVVCVFFLLLVIVLLLITDYGIGSITRARRRSKGLDTFD